MVFADARDGIRRAERALAGYDDIAVGRHNEIKRAAFRIVLDQKPWSSVIGWNTRRQKQPACGIKSEAPRKRHDSGWQPILTGAVQIG